MKLACVPRATARLQLHKGFDFAAAAAAVPYYAQLGISHLYLSPILTARAGSMHGYDVVDHAAVNPELGGEDGLRRLVAVLRAHDMGLIVDIVPNHMAVGRGDNALWLDVLEWGADSANATFFDIDWDVPDLAIHGRVLAPFLGKQYGEALRDGEIELCFDAASGRLLFAYYDHLFPLRPRDYAPLLRAAVGDALAPLARRFREALRGSHSAQHRGFAEAQRALAAEVAATPAMNLSLQALLQHFAPADEPGRKRLHRLLERQNFRLAWWRAAPEEINWRRFFDVIDLAGVRIQEPRVFDLVHATTLRLYAEGLIDGLRVDHVDGLADPRSYCRKLRARLRELAPQRPASAPSGPAYFVVEKILAPHEQLNREWQTDGTSGYVFMNEVGALLHDPAGEAPLTELWKYRSGRSGDFEDEERAARRRIPQELLAADFNACAHALHVLARSEPETRDWTVGAIRRVLAELLVHFPVYRTYVDAQGRSAADAAIMAGVVAAARQTCRPAERPLVDRVDQWLGGEPPNRRQGAVRRRMALRAVARFQQLTSPVAAKSVEDTAFYRHGRLLSRNEVGANPGQFSLAVEDFHRACVERVRRYPQAMLATATHDHKRGEDLRARIAVLSEIPQQWAQAVERWVTMNAALKPVQDGASGPDATDEYILYQMLVGAWPLDLRPDDAAALTALADRLGAWQQKAVREAKRRSGWIEPNAAYEAACDGFLRRLLDPALSAGFLGELHAFVDRIAAAGAVNGLAQTLLRMTTPGVPDLYQGTEFWDFSLVDPDNRRPVDYAARTAALAADGDLRFAGWRDGRIKQQLIARTLSARARLPRLFGEGEYLPLPVRGPLAAAVVAFARLHEDSACIVAAARLPMRWLAGSAMPASTVWQGTRVLLPPRLRASGWRDQLQGARIAADAGVLPAQHLFAHAPVALLTD